MRNDNIIPIEKRIELMQEALDNLIDSFNRTHGLSAWYMITPVRDSIEKLLKEKCAVVKDYKCDLNNCRYCERMIIVESTELIDE